MNIASLSERDLKSLVKFGSDEGIVAQAVNELRERAELRGRSVVDRVAHNHDAAGSIPAPATIPPTRGRWDS